VKSMMYLHKSSRSIGQGERGFSMAESILALVVATTMIGVTAPMFVAQRQRNIDSEIFSGAKSVAVNCLEDLREKDPTTLQITSQFTNRTACNLDADQLRQAGTSYRVQTWVRMAEVNPNAMTNAQGYGNFQCTNNTVIGTGTDSRCVSVRVIWQGKVIHSASSIYASFGGASIVGE
jgi:type II secretory pathway pseudopilin PulG